MPGDFLDKKQQMIDADSMVFEKLDYFMIWALLMLKRYRYLTKFVVQLDPSLIKVGGQLAVVAETNRRVGGASR